MKVAIARALIEKAVERRLGHRYCLPKMQSCDARLAHLVQYAEEVGLTLADYIGDQFDSLPPGFCLRVFHQPYPPLPVICSEAGKERVIERREAE